MDTVVSIAKYMCKKYKEISGEFLSSRKLQALLYFAQKESYLVFGDPLFRERLEATREGIVCPAALVWYACGSIRDGKGDDPDISWPSRLVADLVLDKYAEIVYWKLEQICRSELPWQKAREALKEEGQNKSFPISMMDVLASTRTEQSSTNLQYE